MNSITVHKAQENLADLIQMLSPGQRVTITDQSRPVAQLVALPLLPQRPPRPRPPVTGTPKAGQYEGRLIVPDDFDEPLHEWREYLE
jgi:antitoxin (DNA-binding transcriptional repressor) of toxin-antitoxin stability system